MKLEKLRMRNFRKFKNEEVKFADNLNLIEGENNAGKSSLFYAIYFALTGDAFNFRSPKEYINFDATQMRVDLEFSSNGTRYFIRRSYTHNSGGEYSIGRIEGEMRTVIESTEKGSNASEVTRRCFSLLRQNARDS